MAIWHVAPLRFAPANRALGVCEHICSFSLRDIWATLLSPKWAEIWVGGSRSKERDRKSELVLWWTYQIFEWDRNKSDRNFYNVVRYVHIPLVP